MDAYINGFPLVLDNQFLKAELSNTKNVTNQKNVSVATESQVGFTHFGANTYVDWPDKLLPSAVDVCVLTIEIPAGGIYQFMIWDGGKICCRLAWGSRQLLQNSKWVSILG